MDDKGTYLILATEVAGSYLVTELNREHIKAKYVPLIKVISDHKQLQSLEYIINNYDYVCLTSHTAIESSKSAIKMASKDIEFITSGSKTAEHLGNYTSNSINYPIKANGTDAIISEVLSSKPDLRNKSILIIRGGIANENIQKYCNRKNILFNEIIIYNQQLLDLSDDEFKKIFGLNELQGIIITSSGLATHLCTLAANAHCLSILQMLKFIVLHDNIKNVLANFGICNIHVTNISSYEAIVDTVRRENGGTYTIT